MLVDHDKMCTVLDLSASNTTLSKLFQKLFPSLMVVLSNCELWGGPLITSPSWKENEHLLSALSLVVKASYGT